MRVRVYVTLKPSVFDPQGKTVTDALHSLGYSRISEVRQGKFFEFDVDARTADEATALATQARRTGSKTAANRRHHRAPPSSSPSGPAGAARTTTPP